MTQQSFTITDNRTGKSYDLPVEHATIKALDHVTLEIEPGSFICLSGPSGSGKTTLLNMIGGLDLLDGGEISIDG